MRNKSLKDECLIIDKYNEKKTNISVYLGHF